jgi:transposase
MSEVAIRQVTGTALNPAWISDRVEVSGAVDRFEPQRRVASTASFISAKRSITNSNRNELTSSHLRTRTKVRQSMLSSRITRVCRPFRGCTARLITHKCSVS